MKLRKRKFKARRVIACCMMSDDRFRMGGRWYRVERVATNDYGDPVITFYPLESRVSGIKHTLIVDKNTRFVIYNQR